MFNFAILTGVYAYILFGLGLFGLLYLPQIAFSTSIYLGSIFVLFYHQLLKFKRISKLPLKRKPNKLIIVFTGLFFLQGCVNLTGALSPELSFDALWYHLTLPKLYLINHAVYHIPGGLLYYSDMPKFGELLYTAALAFSNEITVKVIHFLFGLLSSLALYFVSRKYFNPLIALIAVVIFYSNLVVAWESTTAYVDLIRTFFEVMALWGFLNLLESHEEKWLYLSAGMVGLAISTKLIALVSLLIFTMLILIYSVRVHEHIAAKIRKLFIFWSIAILIPLPWFIFSYIHTGNPFYPIFSPVFNDVHAKMFDITLLNPIHLITTFWNVFTKASDPVSPVYLIFLPLIISYYLKSKKKIKPVFIYTLLALLFWYITSQVEGSRMLLPYLPAFSLICAGVIDYLMNKKTINRLLPVSLILLIILTACISIGYRFLASYKYFPVLLGQQSKHEFLSNNLNFSFGDFYDTDYFFKKHMKSGDMVLLYGFHNLYYVDFPFIDSSWVNEGDKFNYVAVQKSEIPTRFKNWQLIYENDKTMVKLFKPPNGLCNKLCEY